MLQFKSVALLVSLLLAALLMSCEKEEAPSFSGSGKKPVYAAFSELKQIKSLPPRPVVLSGPIFLRDTLFFMIDQRKGIHVFNVANPSNPIPLQFWQIPAISDFTLSGNRLYADSWKDLVTIDISDLYSIREIDRQEDAFSPLLFPPLYSGIFECVDESKGAVVDWIDADLTEVRCITLN